ncbi:hypothetical protein [Paenibacillus cremeus]|uniref:ABC transporter permease n=1 Tax=Paenibacillus cremeus TaxID=2163881 RepID=A0A559JVK4_9BACL|nr:hypothetical protein [Paenibacillus cremeus]TVY03923.1 hypothetical protein FPZ49_31255 [Paenibacillus cremeus]
MFHKGLWYQHVKQTKYILWAFWLVAVYAGFKLYGHAGEVESNVKYASEHGSTWHYYFGVDLDLISLLQLMLCIGLPAFLVGFRRGNQSLEYTYAMPVKREHLFLSQWALGMVHIIGSVTLGVLIQLAVVHTTILSQYIPRTLLGMYYIHQLLILSGVFSLSLWLGLVRGSFIAQAAFGVIVLLLPFGLLGMLREVVSLHYFALGRTDLHEVWFFGQATSFAFENLSFPIKLIDIRRMFSLATDVAAYGDVGPPKEYMDYTRQLYFGLWSFLIPVCVTAASVWGMLRMARASWNEHNGKLLLHPRLRPLLTTGVLLCSFLFGGMVVEHMLGRHFYDGNGPQTTYDVTNLLIYYAAAIVSMALAYVIVRRMLGMKLLRWTRLKRLQKTLVDRMQI